MTEEEKAEREDAQRVHDANKALVSDLNRAAIDGANIALKGLLIVNGGAVIALLGFIATLASSEEGRALAVDALVAPLSHFAWGVVYAVGASAAAYITNYSYSAHAASLHLTWSHPYAEATSLSKRWAKVATVMHALGLVASIASLVKVVLGIRAVSAALPIVFAPAP